MIVYHKTTEEAAKLIIEEGFRDGRGTYMTKHAYSGVWVSDQELMYVPGTVIFKITLNVAEDALEAYEWREDLKTYREWLVPAKVLMGWIRTMEYYRDDPDEGWPYNTNTQGSTKRKLPRSSRGAALSSEGVGKKSQKTRRVLYPTKSSFERRTDTSNREPSHRVAKECHKKAGESRSGIGITKPQRAPLRRPKS